MRKFAGIFAEKFNICSRTKFMPFFSAFESNELQRRPKRHLQSLYSVFREGFLSGETPFGIVGVAAIVFLIHAGIAIGGIFTGPACRVDALAAIVASAYGIHIGYQQCRFIAIGAIHL